MRSAFVDAEIDMEALCLLTAVDLPILGINAVDEQRQILRAIAVLRRLT
jgi:hypothetical protein